MFMQTNRQRRAGVLAALLMAGVALGVAPRAVATQPVAQERVPIADLDLSTPAGARAFQQRVNAAIKRVCDAPQAIARYRSLDMLYACRRQAWKGVRAQLALSGRPAARLATRN
jgi:UrcA family protein